MTADHPPLERLSELADGDLAPGVAAAVERHVAGCIACRASLARLRTLIERAAALPVSVDPPPEVWRALQERLPRAQRPIAARRARRGREWGLRAAAAMLLVVGSSTATVIALRSHDGRRARPITAAERRAAPAPVVPAAVIAVERSYASAVDELTETLDAQRATLAPETAATLRRALVLIDEAIAEARAALAADPANHAIRDALSANYEQKVQLLRRASELPART